jgi:phytoene synthase
MIDSDIAGCYDAIRKGSHSFYAASKLLPKQVRDQAVVLYAFCRVADDTVDAKHAPKDAVEILKERLELAYRGTPKNDPVDRAFASLVNSCNMPKTLPDALLEGLEWDSLNLRFETLSDLHSYSARVASAVGVMMCVLMDVRDKDVLARACDLGAAMQLTNIARDIGEDARNGRLYIPLRWMGEESLDPVEFLKNPEPSEKIARIAKRLLFEAERLYNRAEAGLSELPLACRPGIFAARHIYEKIGKHIAAADYDSITQRAFTTKIEKMGFLLLSMANTATVTLMPRSAVVHAEPLDEMKFLIDAASDNKIEKNFLDRKAGTVMNILEQMERRDRGFQEVLE